MEPHEPTLPDTEVYGPRVVAFLDILGFGDLVQRAHNNPSLRTEVINALARVRSIRAPGGGETDLQAQNFSDSLILSARVSPDGLWHLLLSADALAWNLLQLGVFIRGGVTIGGMHHDDQIVFGRGVNEAYRLESTIAKVPRIVLGRKAMEAADHFASQDDIARTYRQSRLLRDKDGVWYLNFLAELGIFNRQSAAKKEKQRSPFFAVGELVRGIIQTKIDGTLDQPDVYQKVEWIARYWNSEVVGEPSGSADSYLGPILLAGQEAPALKLPFRTY